MKFEFDAVGFEESIKEQLRKQFQAKLDSEGLPHVKFSLEDNGRYALEGYRDQEELDRATKAIAPDNQD